jgi:hypothetical protein
MPYRSPFPPFELPHCDWPELIFERRENSLPFPRDHVITQDAETGEGLSFHQVQELSRALGRGLKTQLKFEKGDVICLFSTNHVISVPDVGLRADVLVAHHCWRILCERDFDSGEFSIHSSRVTPPAAAIKGKGPDNGEEFVEECD